MVLRRPVVERALQRKGFRKREGDHSFFIYYTLDGKKTPVRTKTSHGSSHRDIGSEIAGRMARQCRLSSVDFEMLVAVLFLRRNTRSCSKSKERFEGGRGPPVGVFVGAART